MTAIPIVALDFQTAAAARGMVNRLGASCRFYKVGSELFTAAGPDMVRWLRDEGCDVFLDLKFHDIPATMRGAARSAAALGARLITVHAVAGQSGVAAAVEGANGENEGGCGVLVVTVLTSLDSSTLASTWGRQAVSVEDEVLRFSALAADAGAHGVVCSGHEVGRVRERFGDRLAPLVPGIRLAGTASHDQSRVVTPGEAAGLGAHYIVLGRTVTAASDPDAAMRRVNADLP